MTLDRLHADEWTVNTGDRVLPLFGPAVLNLETIAPTPITITGTRESDSEQFMVGLFDPGYQKRRLTVEGFTFLTFDPANDTDKWVLKYHLTESPQAAALRAESET